MGFYVPASNTEIVKNNFNSVGYCRQQDFGNYASSFCELNGKLYMASSAKGFVIRFDENYIQRMFQVGNANNQVNCIFSVNDSRLIATKDNEGFFYSDNEGETWTLCGGAFSPYLTQGASLGNNCFIYGSGRNEIYESTDGGLTFAVSAGTLPTFTSFLNLNQSLQKFDNKIFLLTTRSPSLNQLYVTEDGTNFSLVLSGSSGFSDLLGFNIYPDITLFSFTQGPSGSPLTRLVEVADTSDIAGPRQVLNSSFIDIGTTWNRLEYVGLRGTDIYCVRQNSIEICQVGDTFMRACTNQGHYAITGGLGASNATIYQNKLLVSRGPFMEWELLN